MKTSEYLHSLYHKYVTEKNYNLRIERDLKRHNWLIINYENLKKTEKKTQSAESLALCEKEFIRRIRTDLKGDKWPTQRYKKRDKLEKKPQNSKDIVEEIGKGILDKCLQHQLTRYKSLKHYASASMSRETVMAEEKKMLDFLRANGITTLELLKDIFRHRHNETVEEDVVFASEIKTAKPSISQENLNMILEASARNKEILLNDLSKYTTRTSNPPPVIAQQSGTMDVPGRSNLNAGSTNKNVSSLPMRYRHKHIHEKHPFQKEKSCQQRQEGSRQACEGNAQPENMQHDQYRQHNYHAHNQTGYEEVGQSISGWNNGSGHMLATWPCGGINSIGHTIPVTPALPSTTVYNVVPQQQWPSATSMAHTEHSGYNNFAQYNLAPQVAQQTGILYMVGSRPVYKPN